MNTIIDAVVIYSSAIDTIVNHSVFHVNSITKTNILLICMTLQAMMLYVSLTYISLSLSLYIYIHTSTHTYAHTLYIHMYTYNISLSLSRVLCLGLLRPSSALQTHATHLSGQIAILSSSIPSHHIAAALRLSITKVFYDDGQGPGPRTTTTITTTTTTTTTPTTTTPTATTTTITTTTTTTTRISSRLIRISRHRTGYIITNKHTQQLVSNSYRLL